MPTASKDTHILIKRLETPGALVHIKGETPLILHRMSAKARHQLMLGGRRKSAAERLEIKHHPVEEFKNSMHLDWEFNADTAIKFPVTAFKSAMATAALVTPGMRKTDVQRLIFIPEEYCPIYGIPQLRMDVVRSADIAKTPDIRTRAVVVDWMTVFTVRYTRPQLNLDSLSALLHNAGIVAGVGDFRQEKGKGSYGAFTTAEAGIPSHLLNLKDEQEKAIGDPKPVNDESAELLDEYVREIGRRNPELLDAGLSGVSSQG